mgnify:CR=1 FL=1|tara:strand:+ start:592 stop:792 length:201 start_codon:yes stop_codon:yes gene_type:complete
MIKTITFKETLLEVRGAHIKGDYGDSLTPPTKSYFEIYEIKTEGIDVTNLLEDYVEEIETLILKKL